MATAGLKVWDASGNLITDITTRLTRVINVIVLPAASSGTIDLSAAYGDPWFRRSYSTLATIGYCRYPIVSISGKVISWQNTHASATPYLLYGVY